MDFIAVCRTCLTNTQLLDPIFKPCENKEYHDRYSIDILNTTGLKVEVNDGLPQNICKDCLLYINQSLQFRTRCKDAETKLLQMISENEEYDKYTDTVYLKETTEEMVSMETSEEVFLKTEDPNIKMENGFLSYNSDDEKPLTHLIKETDLDDNTENSVSNHFKGRNVTPIIKNKVNTKKVKNKKEPKQMGFTVNEIENEIKIEVELEINKQRVTCKICKKSLSIRSVDMHMSKIHPGADERKMKCELCEKYVLKEKLNRHLLMTHGTDSYVCVYCKKGFHDKALLMEHVASCTQKKKRRNPCDSGKVISECEICHKKMQKASIKMHQKIKHAGLGPVCDHCGRKFGNKFRLNEHLRSKHGYEKFKCAECDFQTASGMALRNHERRHRGEKPYVCERCGARFHAAYLLAQHKQSHRTEKLLKCDLCPASFKANNSLHMHKMSCHSSSTYSCTLCTRAYSCRHYAVKHLRSVHRYSGPVPDLEQKPLISS